MAEGSDAYKPSVRIRTNLKQTNDQGTFKLDTTIEYYNNDVLIFKIEDPNDLANIKIDHRTIAQFAWDNVEATIMEGLRRGHDCVGLWATSKKEHTDNQGKA